jgi:hypothetical protein
VASPTPRPLYPRERDPVPIVQEAGWAPGPVWTAAENLPSPLPGLRSLVDFFSVRSQIYLDSALEEVRMFRPAVKIRTLN